MIATLIGRAVIAALIIIGIFAAAKFFNDATNTRSKTSKKGTKHVR
ncbi:hypothetical protein JQ506_07765 [Shinella sp. PSBB067]|nr:hypothetical protein [Shinella sp. PSBB067]QRI64877.1 hypothetical protein JQ506_07765 [Shinella sp. PSBB067]